MIKAVIFDCFGVLASDEWLPFRNRHFGHDPELLERAIKLQKQIDAGSPENNYDSFLHKVAEMAGVSYEETKAEIDNNVPDDRLFEYIKNNLSGKFKIGMLSNASDNWLDEIFTSNQVKLFDAVALSYEMRVIKPDARAYQIICERLGVEPSECIFVDDQVGYCQGARAVGMKVIQYKNIDQFVSDLELMLN